MLRFCGGGGGGGPLFWWGGDNRILFGTTLNCGDIEARPCGDMRKFCELL